MTRLLDADKLLERLKRCRNSADESMHEFRAESKDSTASYCAGERDICTEIIDDINEGKFDVEGDK